MLTDIVSSVSGKIYENKKQRKQKKTLKAHSIPLVLFGDQKTLVYLTSVHDVLYERTLVFMFLVNKTNEVKCGLKAEDNLKLLFLHQSNQTRTNVVTKQTASIATQFFSQNLHLRYFHCSQGWTMQVFQVE